MKTIPLPRTSALAKLIVFSFVALLFVGAAQQIAQAQVLYGSLVGRVEDQSGAVLPGARVSVTNKATGQQREAVADESGAFAFRDLQVGTYDLNITQNGFKTYAKSGVIISLNTIVREDVQMTVGGTTETVTITAAASITTAMYSCHKRPRFVQMVIIMIRAHNDGVEPQTQCELQDEEGQAVDGEEEQEFDEEIETNGKMSHEMKRSFVWRG